MSTANPESLGDENIGRNFSVEDPKARPFRTRTVAILMGLGLIPFSVMAAGVVMNSPELSNIGAGGALTWSVGLSVGTGISSLVSRKS